MTGEERLLLYRSIGVSFLLHLLSGLFLWKVQVPSSSLQDLSPFMVHLLPSDDIPRFIDQPDAPRAGEQVKSKDISQVTSEARGPGKIPGPVSTPGSAGTPKPPGSPGTRQPGPAHAPPVASPQARIEAAPSAPPEAVEDVPALPGQAAPEIPDPREQQGPSIAKSPHSSLREQGAAPGTGGHAGEGASPDAGTEGITGTGERIVSLETQSSEFAPYLAEVRRRIQRHWRVPAYAREVGLTARLVLVFSITPEGNLAQVKVTKSSGTSILDEAAVQAVTDGAPYAPFPPRFTFRQLTVVGHFEYVGTGRPLKKSG